jgi:hypothetical protein
VKKKKKKNKSVMGSQNLKENNFENEDYFNFWYVEKIGNKLKKF